MTHHPKGRSYVVETGKNRTERSFVIVTLRHYHKSNAEKNRKKRRDINCNKAACFVVNALSFKGYSRNVVRVNKLCNGAFYYFKTDYKPADFYSAGG